MGCLYVSVNRRCGLDVDVERKGGLGVGVNCRSGLDADIERKGEFDVSVVRRGGIQVYVSVVCTLNKQPFLRVEPTEVQWIDVGLDSDYSVFSNTDWVVN